MGAASAGVSFGLLTACFFPSWISYLTGVVGLNATLVLPGGYESIPTLMGVVLCLIFVNEVDTYSFWCSWLLLLGVPPASLL